METFASKQSLFRPTHGFEQCPAFTGTGSSSSPALGPARHAVAPAQPNLFDLAGLPLAYRAV